ncbi:unnamed protein product [Withania somnifera]
MASLSTCNNSGKLCSSFQVSSLKLSSFQRISVSVQFLHNHKYSTYSAPRPLTVISMAPLSLLVVKPRKVLTILFTFCIFSFACFITTSLNKQNLDAFFVTVTGIIKLALEAGKATPAPPVGPALGSKGVNIMAFCKDYNARTADKAGYVIPVEITVYDDRSFTFILKTPPASVLLLKAAGVEKGSKDPQREKVGKITIDQLKAIAQEKLPDLNCSTIESAMRIIAGTAANMGIDIDPPVLEPKKKELVY